MSVSSTLIEPVNPDVYLNHLSPSDAKQVEITRNTILIILGATVCDILAYVSEDVKIVGRNKFRFVIFCFIFSRLLAVSYVFVNAIGRVMPVDNPTTIADSSACLCMLSMITSSYLFLCRVQAVYPEQKWVRRIFFLLWVVFSATDILIPFGTSPTSIPGTHYFKDAGIPPYVALSPFTLLFFDASGLLAISYKVASMHGGDQRVPWYSSWSGGTLPRLPRAIVRGGQQYYLITVGITTFIGIAICLPSIPRILKPLFPTVMIPLMALMACRVYRNTKLFDSNVAFTSTLASNIPAL